MRLFWRFPEWRRLYLHEERFPYLPFSVDMENPETLANMELAKSLKSISKEGPEAFYKGWIAKAISKELERGGGLIP